MGQSPPGSTYNTEGVGLPFFQGKADFTEKSPVVRIWCTQPKKLVKSGDILISVRAPVGPTNVADQDCAIGRGLAGIRPKNGIPIEYILYYLKFKEPELALSGTGSTFTAIKKENLANLLIPLPSLAEQQRIVARVETLLTHVNATRDRLSKVPLIMKKFRQAVLAAACSGRLTEGWREEQKELESSSDLYNRIQLIRMQKYEQAVVEAKKLKKRLPLKPSFLENREPDSCEIAEIPNEWIWKKVVNLGPFGEDTVKTGPFGAILKSKEFVSSGVPIIAIGNVQWGKFDLNGARVDHVTEEKASELENYRVQTGDVLFTRSGTIGRSLVIPNFANNWLMSYHLLRVRADPNLIIPQYLYFVFAGCESSKEYTSDAIIGSTRPGINTTILENLPVPLPPLAEQHEIIHRVEALFTRAGAVERGVVDATHLAEALTQAVLGKAFRGELANP